jgi:hypothetical protein
VFELWLNWNVRARLRSMNIGWPIAPASPEPRHCLGSGYAKVTDDSDTSASRPEEPIAFAPIVDCVLSPPSSCCTTRFRCKRVLEVHLSVTLGHITADSYQSRLRREQVTQLKLLRNTNALHEVKYHRASRTSVHSHRCRKQCAGLGTLDELLFGERSCGRGWGRRGHDRVGERK